MVKKSTKKFNFEKALEDLESIVGGLESGEIGLDEAMKMYEKGIKVAGECAKALKEAKRKVEVLTKDSEGNFELEPFLDE